jgi:tRNA(Ile)-lysidine synthase
MARCGWAGRGGEVTLLARVEDFIRRHAILAGGETVLIGVSGGGDSVALLHLLAGLASRWKLALHALHVDHRLRADSQRDAEFVTALGLRLGVAVTVAAVDIQRRGSLEAAAREARHAALATHAERIGAARIALGHTLDDQAETVLMRVLTGAGARGLAGIPPVRGRIIRPLLGLRRRELQDELRAVGLGWREDPSNHDRKFLRNRVRHDVLPYLAASVDPGLVIALDRVARLARASVDALERGAATELARHVVRDTDALIVSRSALMALPSPVAVEMLRQAAGGLGSRVSLRAWGHRGLERLLASEGVRPFRLGDVTFEVSGDHVRVSSATPKALPDRRLDIPGRLVLPEIGKVLVATRRHPDRCPLERDPGRALFDAAQLPAGLVVRARRPGDRFRPFGFPRERRLKTLLIDAKVPRWERARVPVVEAAGEIIWVAGMRRGAAAPLRSDTRTVVELALRPLAEGMGGR